MMLKYDEVIDRLEALLNDMVGEDQPEPLIDNWDAFEKETWTDMQTEPYDMGILDSIMQCTNNFEEQQAILDEYLGKDPCTSERALTPDEREGQYMWNQLFGELHSDSIEGEDVYSMCIGYMLAMGYHPDVAHKIVGHPNTLL